MSVRQGKGKIRLSISPVRIFLVDEHPLMRRGLRDLLVQNDYSICGESADAEKALLEIISTNPDLIILDLTLTAEGELTLIRHLRDRCCLAQVLVFTMHEDPFMVQDAFRAGARGYVVKREPPEQLLAAIAQVVRGRAYLSQSLASLMAVKWGEQVDEILSRTRFTEREREVYRLIGQGYRTKEIAGMLHLSPKTIDAYCCRLKEKIGVASTQELHRHAIQRSPKR